MRKIPQFFLSGNNPEGFFRARVPLVNCTEFEVYNARYSISVLLFEAPQSRMAFLKKKPPSANLVT
jgi:hypothetical protein